MRIKIHMINGQWFFEQDVARVSSAEELVPTITYTVVIPDCSKFDDRFATPHSVLHLIYPTNDQMAGASERGLQMRRYDLYVCTARELAKLADARIPESVYIETRIHWSNVDEVTALRWKVN